MHSAFNWEILTFVRMTILNEREKCGKAAFLSQVVTVMLTNVSISH
jgi:hypothetical protein